LLSHRAGIQSLTDLESFWPDMLADPRRAWTADEVLGRVRSLTPVFRPGARFSYSNTGYYVLGMVVEEATGRPLAETLDNQVLGPLGLTRTRLVRDGAMDEPRSHGHTWLPTTRTVIDNTDWNLSWDWTAGAAVSTGADMLELANALFSGRIVSPATLALMQRPTEPGGYGLGIGRAAVFDTVAVGHTGENPGTVTLWYHFPERGTTLFVAVNRSDTRTGPGQDVPVDGLGLAARIFTDAWGILYP
jgi:D-alanyl-D-alanine carboxypeptidase